jgi:hypothetical protein
MFNHNFKAFAAALLLAAAFVSCSMDEKEEDSRKGGGALFPTGAAATVNAYGDAVRIAITSSSDGEWYALLLGEDGSVPAGADEVKAAATESGAMTEGANTFTVSGLSPGVYTAYIVGAAWVSADGTGTDKAAEPVEVLELITVPDINAAPFTAIAGTGWYMGPGRLSFGTDGKASIHGFKYDYTWDVAARTGYVSGHVNNRSEQFDGKKSGDIINALGNFTVDIDGEGFISGITFEDYRETGFEMTFTPARTAPESNSLAGTCWWWLDTSLVLEFLPNGKVLQFSTTGYYPHPHIYSSYWFDPEYRYGAYPKEAPVEVGYIARADRVCSFSTAKTPLGGFIIMQNYKDDRNIVVESDLYFPGTESRYHVREPFNKKGYKEYKHRADFARLTDD